MADDASAPAATAPAAAGTSSKNPGWYIGVNGGIGKLDSSDATLTSSGSSNNPGDPFVDLLQLGVVSFEAGDPLGVLLNPLKPLGDLLAGGLCGPLSALLCNFLQTQGSSLNSFSTDYKQGTVLGGVIGYEFANGLRPEAAFAYRSNDIDSVTRAVDGTTLSSQGDITAMSIFGNVWYDFSKNSRLQPYIGGGAGMSKVEATDFPIAAATTTSANTISGDDTVFSYQLGAGLGYSIMDDAARISLDYRYMVADKPSFEVEGSQTSLETDYKNQSIGLTLRYLLGGGKSSKCPNTPEGVAVDSEGCPLDSDGDGIPDYLDRCPGTAAGAKVDANGCELDSDGDGVPDSRDQCPGTPKGVAVDEKGCPLDSDGDGIPDSEDKCPGTPAGVLVGPDGCPAADADGDGIPDYLDKCPGTPKGIAVGKDGCPLDSDGDGIPDYMDDCPNSPAGAKVLPDGCAPGDCRKPRPGEEVDANGCAVAQTFILRGVKFEFDSDRLTADAKVILDGVAQTLAHYAEIKVELAGHTDNIGSDAYNLGLSERRSNSVKNYLTGKGVDAARMTPVGYGLTQPIATNDSEEGREENRRVELKVLE